MRDRFKTKTFQSALKSYVGDTAQVFQQTIDRLDRDCYCCIEPRRYSAVMFYELPVDVVQSQNHPDMNAILKYLPSWPTPDMTETPDYDRYFISKQDEKKINAALKTLYQKENKKLVKIGNGVFDWKLVHSLMRLTGNLIFFSSTNPKQIAVLYGDDCCAILCPVNAPAEGKLTIESLLEEDL